MKYIALLRGINVGGNNTVSMAELRSCFEQAGFANVSTYINSGNVIFDTELEDIGALISLCENAINMRFGFHVVCSVISARDLQDAADHAPSWWGVGEDTKHNIIFVIPPATASDIVAAVGEAKPEYEKVFAYGNCIFWSAPLATFGRTRYNKIVGTSLYRSITIRNANTMRKLVALTSD